MSKNSHSIQKVFLEIDTTSIVTATSIKNNLAVFLENEIFPLLEKQFKNIENIDNQFIHVEKMEISIHSDFEKNAFSFTSFETKNELKIQFEKEVQKALSQLTKSNRKRNTPTKSDKIETSNSGEIHLVTPRQKQIKTLLFFIENGYMPWWVTKRDEIYFFEEIASIDFQSDHFSIPFKKLLISKTVQRRLINQFSSFDIAMMGTVFSNFYKNKVKLSESTLLQLLDDQSHQFKTSFWQCVFELWLYQNNTVMVNFYQKQQTFLTSEKVSFEHLLKEIQYYLPRALTEKELEALANLNTKIAAEKALQLRDNKKPHNPQEYPASEDSCTIELNEDGNTALPASKDNIIEQHLANKDFGEIKKDPDDTEIDLPLESCYIRNTGLIILHPFLKELLKNCDLLDAKNMPKNKEMAAHILHYAATKKEEDYEHLMLFEKFLCGIPLQQSIQRDVKIKEEHKKHVEEMLGSVVSHWTAIKSTSTGLLRSEFLQREGKLDCSESNPKVIIERKTQDLLLDKIPWNISIIKIPWLEKLVYTQW